MAILKAKEITKMSIEDIEGKIKELKTELIKTKVAGKSSKLNQKEIKRTIARLLTIKNIKEKQKEKKEEKK